MQQIIHFGNTFFDKQSNSVNIHDNGIIQPKLSDFILCVE